MFSDELATKAANNLTALRIRKPLIHNITNFVVMNFTANALLAFGASPVMAHAPEEVEEMVAFAGALVLNIGTLTRTWVESMLKAGRKANELGIPVVLDPVGAGATTFRTGTAMRLAESVSIHVIRGNASEVLSLARKDSQTKTKGVDAVHGVDEAESAAVDLAQKLGTTLAITGPVDLVTDGKSVLRVFNGHERMGSVTGTGCVATALIGAFLAVDGNSLEATATALAAYGLAGEEAAGQSKGPGTFHPALLDALFNLDAEKLKEKIRIES
ncbi:MAG: hydroxyethylthiazole kinase [Deltaproteobacteria bacterium]|jgi:hydroxyethylthiazole kinase|nr:hydroxyethylthiazole kinase [Deltaproteobacteria bacterium]